MSDNVGRYYRVWETDPLTSTYYKHIGNVYAKSIWQVGKAIQKELCARTGRDMDMLSVFKLYRVDRVPCDE